MSRTIQIEPFNRVEGDIRIHLEIESGRIQRVRAAGVMYRGFEKILCGHFPEDALVYTPRICGICSISHSVAASNALRAASHQFTPSTNGQWVANIAHATETAMSHITHFYLSFAPDLLNRRYREVPHFTEMQRRFAPLRGDSVKQIIAERKRFLEILGLTIGKWPHSLAIHPGGVTKSLNLSEIFRVRGVLKHFCQVMERVFLGMPGEEYLQIKTRSDFETAFPENGKFASDLGLLYHFARSANLFDLGPGPNRFICAGAYAQPDGSLCIPSGYWDGEVFPLQTEAITESVAYSFFSAPRTTSHPFDDESEPQWDKPMAYSWAKAPRYNNMVVEVGALARQMMDGDLLIREFQREFGSTVYTRVFARLHETIKLLTLVDSWIDELGVEASYYTPSIVRESARAFGFTEAARGFLGHWLQIADSKIANYQVITPTAFNASPRDELEQPGALEQALQGTQVADENNLTEVDLIIRSFDPCLVCTVH